MREDKVKDALWRQMADKKKKFKKKKNVEWKENSAVGRHRKSKTVSRSFAGGAATEEGGVHCDLSEQTPEIEQEVDDLPLCTDAFWVICSFTLH